MSGKPSYLGLLNAISVGESAAGPIFGEWADRTDDAQLAEVLRFVAMRETEHGIAFAKRMLELGYPVRATDGDPQQRLRDVVASDRDDAAKLEAVTLHAGPAERDVFDEMFTDKTIDPITGALLGRYIAEERDTLWRLKAEYDRLTAS